ncbi:hypothetical protein [Halorubrum aquaticum]|uniref:hypothetical protein n=1 Tax=Halorubrum aquaticum TaxID=387340 RepID=UPI00122CAF3D|nr:hypothetical protein [Halorubrum aquaticum]
MAVNIQFGTLILALTTLIGAFVGATVRILWQIRNEQKRRENLRRAIWAEMMTMRPYLSGKRGPEDQFLRKTVYECNADDLGLLTENEVEAIVAFYGSATNVQRASNSSKTDHMEPTNVPTAIMNTGVQQWFNHAVEQLYPYVDIDDDLEDIQISATLSYG